MPVERRDGQGRRLVILDGEGFDLVLLAVADGETVGPLAGDLVEGLFLLACRVQGGGEAVLLAAQPSFAAVVDLGRVAGRGLDVGGLVQLDEGTAVDETFDVERRERDEVVFVVFGEVEDGVSDLLDVDCARERGFLGIVALQLWVGLQRRSSLERRISYPYTVLVVPNTVRRYRWMVATAPSILVSLRKGSVLLT